ncbi:MAG: hypothetical protein NZO41_01770 [Candidatus Bipolaricaulota bacterium]|nr:hypothetical protein [Candidatus Bipolaricaulota bacterium]MDW8140934.1 hypothetical protein [Candidatus Bipolaricaulota bacterium]
MKPHKLPKKRPTLSLQGPLLTVIIAPDVETKMICAVCPELDIVAEGPSEAETVQDLLEAIRDYAEEYREDLALYLASPNRAHHWPYLQAVLQAKDDWHLKRLLDVRYGILQI